MNQMVAQRLLHNLGHFVDIAGDGRQALEAVRKTDYDVVLMDIHMPGMDGLDATRAIRSLIPKPRQPQIVAMTASSLPEDRRACAEAGMDGYLLKPVRLADLVESLHALPVGAPRPPSTPSVVPNSPVDLEVLIQLTADMGATSLESRRNLIEAYLEQADAWIPELDDAAHHGDAERSGRSRTRWLQQRPARRSAAGRPAGRGRTDGPHRTGRSDPVGECRPRRVPLGVNGSERQPRRPLGDRGERGIGRMRVLAVDDDTVARMAIHGMVTSLGHECLLGRNGAQAWELLQQAHFDVLITDRVMPDMDGLALCRKIRAEAGTGTDYLYIILASALGEEDQARDGMLAGADDYLAKPLRLRQLELKMIAAERVSALHRQLTRTTDDLRLTTERDAETNRRLTEVNQLQSDMMAMLSHDARQPLAAVIGFVESTLEDWDEVPDKIKLNHLGRAAAAARRLDQLIEDVLTMATWTRARSPAGPGRCRWPGPLTKRSPRPVGRRSRCSVT